MDVYDRIMMQETKKKKIVTFSADSYSLTFLCLLKENIRKYSLNKNHLNRSFWFSMTIFTAQMLMLGCLIAEFTIRGYHPSGDDDRNF